MTWKPKVGDKVIVRNMSCFGPNDPLPVGTVLRVPSTFEENYFVSFSPNFFVDEAGKFNDYVEVSNLFLDPA